MNSKTKAYKRYTLFLLLTTVAALVVCAAAFALKRDAVAAQGSPEKKSAVYYTPKPASSQETPRPQPSPQASVDERYTVTVYNGRIGVFREGEATPFLTSSTDLYLLPQEDVDILKRGIRADSFTEVKRILEDYE